MKTTLNLAARHNRARHLTDTIACWLLPLLVCCLIYLLVGQGMALHRRQSLESRLAGLKARTRALRPQPAKVISDEEIKHQQEELAFLAGLTEMDRFSWTELLGRLERALTRGITLTGIEPNYQARSLQIAGLAEDVSALRGYLASLLHSDSLARAYLLRQESRKVKDRFDREHTVIAFRIEIEKAF